MIYDYSISVAFYLRFRSCPRLMSRLKIEIRKLFSLFHYQAQNLWSLFPNLFIHVCFLILAACRIHVAYKLSHDQANHKVLCKLEEDQWSSESVVQGL